jgi:hypothetical protein
MAEAVLSGSMFFARVETQVAEVAKARRRRQIGSRQVGVDVPSYQGR